MLHIETQDGEGVPVVNGRVRLQAEVPWIVRGGPKAIDAAAEALPARAVERIAGVLRLRFINEVGIFTVPGLPPLDVYSGKWAEADYDAMLGQICARIASLPFSAGAGAQIPYDRSIASDPGVLYHAYVYLRHVLLSPNLAGAGLAESLRLILRSPHRRFERRRRATPPHRCRRVDARTVLGIVRGERIASGSASGPLADLLGGHFPTDVDEPIARSTFDVPENRFVSAFLTQCVGIIEAMAAEARASGGAFRARVEMESAGMLKALAPVRQASLWREVGTMRRLPVESTVLQRAQGYRQVFRHFVRLRMATRIPFDTAGRDLIEVKDIASLYEIWCFFAVEQALSEVLGPPGAADSATTTALQRKLGYAVSIRWPNGIELAYNQSFSRTAPVARRSYALPLRPDITLRLPDGQLHVLDAKFKLRELPTDDDDEPSSESDFKRADIYKMHAYRDALGSATAWVLYPGTSFRFFGCRPAGAVLAPSEVLAEAEGVGGIPLSPGQGTDALQELLRSLLLRGD